MLLMDVAQTGIAFCTNTKDVWQTVGWLLFIFKIVVPILLIIFGMIDLGKAVIGSKDDEIKKATKQLLMRAIAAIVIFLIPSLVSVLFKVVGSFGEVEDDYRICSTCITSPDKCGAEK